MSKQQDLTIRSTKADLFKAYEEMKEELERTQGDQLPLPQQSAIKANEEKILKKTENFLPETLEGDITSLRKKVQNNLEELKEQLIKESQNLNDLRKAIEIETKQLEEVYNIKLAADTLQTLIADYEIKFDELTKKKNSEETIIKEEIAHKKKEWEREQEEYKYTLKIERKKEQDEYEIAQSKGKAEWQANINKKEAEIEERENFINTKENEIENMRKEIETFPKKLESAIKEIKTETEKNLQKDFSIQKQILEQQWTSEKMILETKVGNLQELIKNQISEIISLKKSLSEANQRAQDLAAAVIENAGYKQAKNEENFRKDAKNMNDKGN